MVSCALPSCNSTSGIQTKKLSGITFHRFPEDPLRKQRWIEFVGRGNWKPSKYSVLCSRHFLEQYMDRTSLSYVRLKDDAVPTMTQEIKVKCAAINCNHNNLRTNCNFFTLPTEPEIRKKWLQLLRKNPNNVSDLLKVCSCHFRDGKKENLPEIYSLKESKNFDELDASPDPKTRKRTWGIRCAVISCINTPGSVNANGSRIRFHTFPKIAKVKDEWIKFCERIGKWNPDTSRICSIHFKKEDYERNLQSELLGLEARPILKKNAVPSLHSAYSVKQRRTSCGRTGKRKPIDEIKEKNDHTKTEPDIYNLLDEPSQFSNYSNLDLIQNIKEQNSNIEIEIINDQNQHETEQSGIKDMVEQRKTIQTKDLSVRLVRLDDLGDRYSELMKEQFLKSHLLTKVDRSSLTTKTNVHKENRLLKERIIKIGELSKSLEIKFNYLYNENKQLRKQLATVKPKSVASTSMADCHKNGETYEKTEYKTLFVENKLLNEKIAKMRRASRSLEMKFTELQEENEFLQQRLDYLKQSSKSEREVDNLAQDTPTHVETSNVIDLTDIFGVCRICLQKNEILISVDDKIISAQNDFPETKITKILRELSSDPVKISDNTTSKICILCKNQLQQFITLKYIYKKATSILQLYANGVFGNKIEKGTPDEHSYFKEGTTNEEENVETKLDNDHLLYIEEDVDTYDKTKNQNADSRDDIIEIDNKDDNIESNFRGEIKEEQIAEKISESSYMKNYLFKLNRKKEKKVTHTCPTCWIQLPIEDFIPHVKMHKVFKKYLSCSRLPKNARIYAPPRNVESLLRDGTEKMHSCPICNEEFKASEFIMHVDHHLKNDQFTCDKCNRVFKKKAYLRSHILVHNTDFPYRCSTCNKGFVVKDNYECHLITHKDEEYPYKCTECDRRFFNPKHLARHMTIHTENRSYSKKYKYLRCKYCHQTFSNRGLLNEHVCQQEGIFVCIHCDKRFVSAKTRQMHFMTVHKQGVKKPTYCNICNVSVTNIQTHKIKYHGKGKMGALCTVCGLYVVNIYNHMLKHIRLKEKPFKCPICPSQFAYKNLLKRHLEAHNGLKPYICSYCAKAFSSQYNMEVHERIHIGNKKHMCPMCNKGFLEKSYLSKHMKTHKRFIESDDRIEYSFDQKPSKPMELQRADNKIEYELIMSLSDQECEEAEDDYELMR